MVNHHLTAAQLRDTTQLVPMAFLLQFSVGLLAIYAATSLLSFLAGSCLRAIPGPRIAAFTRFWSFFRVFRGNAPQNDQQLHQKYGQIVRTGPKHVSFSDINMIPVVYGIGSDYLKVRSSDFAHSNVLCAMS